VYDTKYPAGRDLVTTRKRRAPADARTPAGDAPALRITADVVMFTIRDEALHVLLVRRPAPPFAGQWAIPGGFVGGAESLEAAALRRLREETGVADVYLEQLYTFGAADRDPRGRVVSVAYYTLISADDHDVRPPLATGSAANSADARWWPMASLPPLAFDHRDILDYALVRLRNKLEYTTVGFQLLPEKFTLTELQRVYEVILGRPLDKRNFRRKVELLEIVTPLREYRRGGVSRPAQLFTFRGTRYAARGTGDGASYLVPRTSSLF